jgi:putative ABC transport system ATP-binding protein
LTSVIDGLGIKRQLDKLPASLSVGERQRVAIARALAHRPSIVIADEPTASLDPLTAQKTMALFVRLTEELGLTLIVASHDEWLLNRLGLRQLTQRFRESRDGAIVESEFLDPS